MRTIIKWTKCTNFTSDPDNNIKHQSNNIKIARLLKNSFSSGESAGKVLMAAIANGVVVVRQPATYSN